MIDIELILLELDSIKYILDKQKANRNPNDLSRDVAGLYDDAYCLQSVKGCSDAFYATGAMSWYDHKEIEFNNFIFDQLKYTNSIIEELGLYRTRVLTLKPKTCYNFHKDNGPRIHIPLITNDDCIFIIDDKIHRFPADGNYYYVDTTKKHSAMNGSQIDRIHLVGCIHEKLLV